MSTNEELIATNRDLIEQYDPAFAHVLKVTTDRLEQTTREREHQRSQHKQAGALLQNALVAQKQAEDALAKVREWAQSLSLMEVFEGAVPDPRAEQVLAILDESA